MGNGEEYVDRTHEFSPAQKIETVLEWAETKQDFDTSFVKSIENYLEKHERITDRQEEALDNIIRRFKIEL